MTYKPWKHHGFLIWFPLNHGLIFPGKIDDFFQREGMGLCDPQHGSQQPGRSGGSGGWASAGRGADARQVRWRGRREGKKLGKIMGR